jgi:serine phosphatase RsbU (regulator of sigma subunit)
MVRGGLLVWLSLFGCGFVSGQLPADSLEAELRQAQLSRDARQAIRITIQMATRFPAATASLDQAERALSLADSLDEPDLARRVIEVLLPLELLHRRYAVGLALTSRYRFAVDSLAHPERLLLVQQATAEILMAHGDFASARQQLHQALRVVDQTHLTKRLAQLLLSLSRTERNLGELDSSLTRTRALLRRCSSATDSCFVPRYAIESELGLCLLAKREFTEAAMVLTAAATEARAAYDSLSTAMSLLGLAALHLAQDQPRRSLDAARSKELISFAAQDAALNTQLLHLEHETLLAMQNGGQASRVYARLARHVQLTDSLRLANWLGQLPYALRVTQSVDTLGLQTRRSNFRAIVQGFIALVMVLAICAVLVRWALHRRRREELKTLGSAKARTKTAIEQATVLANKLTEEARQQQDVFASLQAQNLSLIQVSAEIEQHATKLTSSMEYTVRIQQALFPAASRFDHFCNDWFLLQQPKDIVASDFYWLHEAGQRIVIAVGSCSSQGVPGALISVAANSILSQVVLDREIPDAGTILTYFDRDFRRMSVVQSTKNELAFSLAVLVVDRTQRSLYFASAGLPLYYSHRGKLFKLNGNQSAIGEAATGAVEFFANFLMYDVEHNFYLVTPGISRQLGGSELTPLGDRRMAELLENTAALGLTNQRQALAEELASFRGRQRQTADILAMGFNFKS